MDIWILSRLALAVETCNTSFENYELNIATTACYNFWLYDLCDVYLVIKITYYYFDRNIMSINSRNHLNPYLHPIMKRKSKLFKTFYFAVWIRVYGYYHHLCLSLLKNFTKDCHILILPVMLVYLSLPILKL